MPIYQVDIYMRGPGDETAGFSTQHWGVQIDADNLLDAEANFLHQHLSDGRYRIVRRDRLFLLERANVLRIEIKERSPDDAPPSATGGRRG